MNWKDKGMTKYEDYFTTDWWFDLNWKLVKGNRDAKCWICERTDKLLIHHISYDNLFAEKLFKDIYILCFDCHNKTHFWFFRLIKVPLRTDWLLLSMRLNRSIFLTQSHRFGLSLLWFLLILVLVPINLAKFLFKNLFAGIIKLIWRYFLKKQLYKWGLDITKN